jgi:coproporphyrinogen III oxidase-like Fe-S oxidoreductase
MARVEGAAPVDRGLPPAADGWEEIDRPTAMAEMFMLNLRLVDEGIDLRRFEARFGLPADTMFGKEIARLEDLGLLRRSGEFLKLDQRAYLLSNQVFARFMPDA